MLTLRLPTPSPAHLVQVAAAIYREHGFVCGFYCGVEPAVMKGASTNCIRFTVFGSIKPSSTCAPRGATARADAPLLI